MPAHAAHRAGRARRQTNSPARRPVSWRTRLHGGRTPSGAARRLSCQRAGLTVIELLVSIAVIGMLLALTIPAVVAVRESSRKASCVSHLRQIGLAVTAYESTHRIFPPGVSWGASLHVALLPHVDLQPLYDQYDFVARDDSRVRSVVVPLYLCPSDPAGPTRGEPGVDVLASTSYAGNTGTGIIRAGYNGLFQGNHRWPGPYPEGPVRASDVLNGLSNTAAVAEVLHADGSPARLRTHWMTPRRYETRDGFAEFMRVCAGLPRQPAKFGWLGDTFERGTPWTRGGLPTTLYNHVLPPNAPSCINGGLVQHGISSPASLHAGGIHVLYADGRATFVSETIDLAVWTHSGARRGDGTSMID